MAPHSSTLAWKIPWMEEPGRLQSMGSPRVRHDWATSFSLFTFMHWRRKWQPTPVFLPGESQGWGSLVGCHLWGRTESDMTENDLAAPVIGKEGVQWLGNQVSPLAYSVRRSHSVSSGRFSSLLNPLPLLCATCTHTHARTHTHTHTHTNTSLQLRRDYCFAHRWNNAQRDKFTLLEQVHQGRTPRLPGSWPFLHTWSLPEGVKRQESRAVWASPPRPPPYT